MTENSTTENNTKHCKFCLSQIRKAAKVCYHCGRDQRWLNRNLSNIPILVSIGLLLLSSLQLCEARNERISATTANIAANDAVTRAQKAEEKVLKTAAELRQVVKLVVENSFITAQSGMGLVMGADPDAKKRLESNLDKLSKFAQPDSKEEERWWAEIHKLYPQYRDNKK
jgi:exoribonuclease II